jgi:hypothetical protein
VATFGASTGNPNPSTAAITTRSALPLAIEGEAADINSHLIPLPSRRRHRKSLVAEIFVAVADSFDPRRNWPAGSLRCSRPDLQPEE